MSVAHRMFQKRHKSKPSKLTMCFQNTVEPENNNERKILMRKALQQLGEKCREILIAKYHHNYSIEEIMEETGVASRATVRTQKTLHAAIKRKSDEYDNYRLLNSNCKMLQLYVPKRISTAIGHCKKNGVVFDRGWCL